MPFKNFRISEKLSSLPTLPLGQLTELQGELKELSTVNYQKLKRSIEDKGFIVPVFVWQEPETAVNYICDGHQRSRCLIREKIPLDTAIPVVFIEAANLQEAKENLLVISSQYGLITQEGYDTFTFDLDEAYLQEMVNFDALKVWEESTGEPINPEDEWTGMPEFEHDDLTSFRRIIVHFANQDDVDRFSELVGQNLTENTRSIWYPKAEIDKYMDKAYKDKS